MPVMDEFREEREALKHGTLKEKISYFLYYYKWHVVTVIAVIAIVVSFIYQTVNQKDRALFVALLNVYELDPAQDYDQRFAEYAGIDTDTYEVFFDTSMHMDTSDLTAVDENTMATTQKLMVYLAAREIDVLIASESTTNTYAYTDTFCDLSTFLSREQYAKYEPYFYYMDRALLEERNDAALDEEFVSVPDYPSPRNPESMKAPVPVGIYLDAADGLRENYIFTDESIIFSPVINGQNPENASLYLDFIFENK